MTERRWVLTLHCQDKPRIVATVTTAIADIGGNIGESAQFWDRSTNRFFMRIAFVTPESSDRKTVETVLSPVFIRFEMTPVLTDVNVQPRIIIMVSKFDHCLQQLLYDIKLGWLKAEVVAIASNHDDQRATAELLGISYQGEQGRAGAEALRPLYRDQSRSRRACPLHADSIERSG